MNWQKRFFEKVNKMNSLKQERGSILVLTVILLPIMFAFLGFAFDFGNIYMHKARLQNVADAAALAGARAYLNSQTNEDPNDRDSVDGIVDRTGGKLAANSSATYKEGRSTPDVYNVRDTQKTKNRDYSNHKAADRAADEYIYHNIANLGNVVKSDRWSHYAINSDNTDPKTFYRVGLYEEVPLYFLPIIQSIGKTQTVRAGAIAVVEKGTGDSGGGGTTPIIRNASIFDNLYTYSHAFDSARSNEQGHDLHTSYSGNMVFTYGNGDPNAFYDMSLDTTNFVDHLFTDLDTNNLQNLDSTSYNWKKVNDPIINTYFNTEAYITVFKNKVNNPHVDVSQKTPSFTGGDAPISYGCEYYIEGKSDKYTIMGRDYYLLDATGSIATLTHNGNDYKICYHLFPNELTNWVNAYVRCAKNDTDGKYYFLDNNNQVTSHYFQVETRNDNGWIHDVETPSITWAQFQSFGYVYYYQYNFKSKQISGGGNTNIFHVSNAFIDNGNSDGSFNIHINGRISGEDTSKPIYIIIDESIKAIEFAVSNNVRPVIVAYFGNGTIKIESGDNVKANIYAPYATFPQMHISGNFHGSIVAKSIYYQASGNGNSWYQDNYLEGKYGYTDSDVAAVTQAIKDSIENSAKLPDNIKADIFSQYANALNIDVSEMQGDNWYSKQSYANKQKLYTKWKQLYAQFKDQYPQYLNQLWPWNEHFDVQGEPVATDGTLRLINYRTDYLDNGQANAVVDPFIFLSLEKPDAY